MAEGQHTSESRPSVVLTEEGEEDDCLKRLQQQESFNLWDSDDDLPPEVNVFLPQELDKKFARKDGTYGFTPLQLDKREIRLRVLEPGPFGSPINCRVIHTVLGSWNQPGYEALSYTWADRSGDYSYSHMVQCGDQRIPVTKNGEAALRRVRLERETRMIWIDQLCINQSDVSERGHQVGLMPHIYANATQVLIYLGPYTDFAEEIFAAAKAFAVGSPNKSNRFSDKITCAQLRTEMLCLLRIPWFTRIWVLQEVAAARKALVLSSNTCIEWDIFRSFAGSWHTKTYNTERIRGVHRSSMLPGALGLTTRQLISVRDFLTLLVSTSSCNAGDARDKVFALFGIVVDADQHRLSADYTKTPEQVFTETAIFLIRQSLTLDVLSFCEKRPIRSTSSDLPSWVPNWGRKCGRPLNDEIIEATKYGYIPTHMNTDWDLRQVLAIKGCPGPRQFVIDQRRGLTVMGRLIAEVTTANKKSPLFVNDFWRFRQIFDWAAETGKELFQAGRKSGFSKEKVRENDQIWHLDGANVLFVLRKFSDGFVLVSECYMRGLSFTSGIKHCFDCSDHSCPECSAQRVYVEITIY